MDFKNMKIKFEWKLAFLSCIIIGVLSHIYIFTNSFPNHDGLYNIYSTQDCTIIGRWFLQIACLPSSYFTLPAVIGLLSITYISITSVIIVELFNIKNKINIILISGFLVLFPAVASNFAYMYTMDGYMLALLLSSLSVLITYKYKWGVYFGAILLCFSIGIYQAYISFAIILCIIKILVSFIKNEDNYLKEILRDVILIFLGFIFYYIILRIVIKTQDISLTAYQGANQLVEFKLINVFIGAIKVYRSFIVSPVKSNIFYNNSFILICNITMLLLLIYIYFKNYICKKIYKNWIKNLLLVVIIMIIPICFNIIILLSPSTSYHMLMKYSWCLPYILLIILVEKFSTKTFEKTIYIVCSISILFNFYIITNIAYFNMEQKFNKTYSLALRLVNRIEEYETYTPDMPVAIIGFLTYPTTDLTTNITRKITGSQGDIIFFDPYHYQSFFKNYIHFSIVYASNEQIQSILITPEYKSMGVWPKKDCIQTINNVLVINLSKVN